MARSDSLQTDPDFMLERAAMARGTPIVAGVDEAGRGPLAGPVVVAAVHWPHFDAPAGLNDSKKLSAGKREVLFAHIVTHAVWSVVVAPPSVIDRLNIRGATLWAMRQAALSLSISPDFILVDGRDIPPSLPCPAAAVIGGDGRSLSIAAASIIAKVTRDRMCPIMDQDAPGFSFGTHKGYGSSMHMQALRDLRPCMHHRASFAPVREQLERYAFQ